MATTLRTREERHIVVVKKDQGQIPTNNEQSIEIDRKQIHTTNKLPTKKDRKQTFLNQVALLI